MSEASRFRVHIATTSGPVEIQRITEEDPDIDSVVCLAGKAMPLPISAGYHNFVRQPTGLIQRLFGHASYRIDLSATIEDGYSWQLGVLVGHAAKAAGRFAGATGASADGAADTVFATGEVNVDQEIIAVGHVAAKLDRLTPAAKDAIEAGSAVTIVVPAANRGDVDEARYPGAGLDPGRCRLVFAATVAEALAPLGLEGVGRRGKPPVPVVSSGRKQGRPILGRLAVLAAIALLVAGLGGWAVAATVFAEWRGMSREGNLEALDRSLAEAHRAGGFPAFKAALYESWLDGTRPSDGAVDLTVIEYRAPEGRTCAAVRFGAAEARPHTPERLTTRSFAPARFDGLCALEIVAAAGDGTFLWGRYDRRLVGSDPKDESADTIELGPSRGTLRWKIDLPRRLSNAFDMRVVVAAARHPVDGAQGWLAGRMPPSEPPENARDWRTRTRTLNERGITLLDATYRLSP